MSDSASSLIGDSEPSAATSDGKIDTTPRLHALRALMAEEQIDYL